MSEAENGKEITFDLLFDTANEQLGLANKVIISVFEAEAKLLEIGAVLTLGPEGSDGEPYEVIAKSLPEPDEAGELVVRAELKRCRA